MTKEKHSDKYSIGIVVGVIILLRLALPLLLPFGQTTVHHLEGLNDEPAHFNYVKYLAVNHSFPVLTHWVLEPDAFVRNEFEYHQAPLYYLLCVPLYLLFGENGSLIPCRLLSALFGILSVWLVTCIIRDLGHERKVRIAAALFTGLLFSHVYFSSVVSNDSLSWLLALLVTRGLLRVCMVNGNPKQGPSSIVLMTVYCAAGLLTKSSFLMLMPIVFGVYGYLFIRSKKPEVLLQGVIITGSSSLLAAAWYIRNLLVYHTVTGMPVSAAPSDFSTGVALGFFKGVIKYFWYPMQNLDGGTTAFAVLTLCGAGLVALHLVFALYGMAEKKNRTSAAIMLMILLIVNILAAFWYNVQWQNPEARFLFPALGSIIAFMIIPANGIFERWNIGRLFLPYIFLAGLFPYAFLIFAN